MGNMKITPDPVDPSNACVHPPSPTKRNPAAIFRALEIALMTLLAMFGALQFLFMGFWSFAVVAAVRGVIVPFLCLVLICVIGINVYQFVMVGVTGKEGEGVTRFRKIAFCFYAVCWVVYLIPLLLPVDVFGVLGRDAFSASTWLFLSLHRLNLGGWVGGGGVGDVETHVYRTRGLAEGRDDDVLLWSRCA